MESLDNIYKQIQGQSSDESINQEAEEQLQNVENTEDQSVNSDQTETGKSPIDSTEPNEDVENKVVEPEDSDTSKKVDTSEGEGEDGLSFELDDLDLDDEGGVDTIPTTPEYVSKIAKELGDDSIKSEDDVYKTISTLRGKLEELETSSSTQLDNIPDDLAKAINVAKAGGDYKSVLGLTSIDYSKVDPIELYENEVIEAMKDENGNVDYDKVDEYLDSLSDVDKKLKGKELQKKYIDQQQQQLSQVEADALAKQQEADRKLEEAVNSKSEIAGFKLKPQHKQVLVDGIKSGNMMKEMFLDSKGQYDFGKISDTYFKIKFFDKIQKVYENKIKNSTKKEIIDSVTNADIDRPQRLTNADENKKSRLDNYVESLMNKN